MKWWYEILNDYEHYFKNRGLESNAFKNKQNDLRLCLQNLLGNKKDIAILDVGCGLGQNMIPLINEGYNVKGIDLSEDAVNYCLSNGYDVKKIDVLDYNEEKFDIILMSHVLEHVAKDKIIEVLSHIKNNLLKTNGSLCVMVPNAQSNTDCYWAFEDFTHSTIFTAGSLLYVLREAGFENIRFIDKDGLSNFWGKERKKRKKLLEKYKKMKMFWNDITGSSYNEPSPIIYTWELQCIASTASKQSETKDIEAMRQEWMDLIAFAKNNANIYLYGTGVYSGLVRMALEKENISICGYVVTNKTNDYHDDLPVYSVSDRFLKTKDIGVILSLQPKYYKEVNDSLCEENLHNIFFMNYRLVRWYIGEILLND